MPFERLVPPGTGEEKFKAAEADARAGLPKRAAEAQKRAAERARRRREQGGTVDLTEDLERVAEEIKDTPDAFEEGV